MSCWGWFSLSGTPNLGIDPRFPDPKPRPLNPVYMRAQASASVQHLVLPCHWSQRPQVTGDLVRCYGACGRTIVCARPGLRPRALSTSTNVSSALTRVICQPVQHQHEYESVA